MKVKKVTILPHLTVITEIKTLVKQIQSIKKSRGKSVQPMDFKISRKKSANQKSRDFYQIFVISNKKSIGYDMDLKIYRKSRGVLFVVISISGGHHHQARAHHQPIYYPISDKRLL
jgi:hypothetical protein